MFVADSHVFFSMFLRISCRRAINGGKPSLPAVKALCECVRKATSLGSAALPPLQRLYAWLLFETAADVQEWIAQVRAHEALVSALALPCRQVALWSCHVITGAASNHQRNAKAFAKAGADQALRGFAGRYVQDGEVAAAVTGAFACRPETLTLRRKKARAIDSFFSRINRFIYLYTYQIVSLYCRQIHIQYTCTIPGGYG